MKYLNVEIKAKCSDQGKIRKLLESLGADFKGVDLQTDVYFRVNSGRLKLRRGNIENHLIFYRRENKTGPKRSDTILLDTYSGSPLEEILAESVGRLVTVEKRREIYFIDNVKFHLDKVKGLGTFVEIEAIDLSGKAGKEKLLEQCHYYMNLFGIKKEDLLADSYSDMLLGKKNHKKNNFGFRP